MLHRGTIAVLAVTAAVLLAASHYTGLLHSVGELPPTYDSHGARKLSFCSLRTPGGWNVTLVKCGPPQEDAQGPDRRRKRLRR